MVFEGRQPLGASQQPPQVHKGGELSEGDKALALTETFLSTLGVAHQVPQLIHCPHEPWGELGHSAPCLNLSLETWDLGRDLVCHEPPGSITMAGIAHAPVANCCSMETVGAACGPLIPSWQACLDALLMLLQLDVTPWRL